MYCKYCGQELNDGAAFCKYCGMKMDSDNAEEQNVANRNAAYQEAGNQNFDNQVENQSQDNKRLIKIIAIAAAAVLAAIVLIIGVAVIIGKTSKVESDNEAHAKSDSEVTEQDIDALEAEDVDNTVDAENGSKIGEGDNAGAVNDGSTADNSNVAGDVNAADGIGNAGGIGKSDAAVEAEPAAETVEADKYDFAAVSVGDIISFGNYMGQDITWNVLEVADGKMLVISRDILAYHPYDQGNEVDYDKLKDTSWEQSEIRSWLNNEFIYEIFNDEEQKMVLKSVVENPSSRDFYESYYKEYVKWFKESKNACGETADKLFLLSWEELVKYYGPLEREYYGDKDTDFYLYLSPKIYELSTYYEDMWLLRSQGIKGVFVLNVCGDGSIYDGDGEKFDTVNQNNGVRPAMWVKR